MGHRATDSGRRAGGATHHATRSKPGSMALKKAFCTNFPTTCHVSACGLSTGPDRSVTVAASSRGDRKSTRLNSSHSQISYAVFCLKKKKQKKIHDNQYAAP